MVSQLQTQGSVPANSGALGFRTLLFIELAQGALWKAVEGHAIVLFLLAPSLIILCPLQEWRFSDQELGHVTQPVCQPPNQRAAPEDCNASLSALF